MKSRRFNLLAGALSAFMAYQAPLHAAGPPCKIGDVVRAGVLNYDAKIVEHNAAKGLYKVRYVTGYPGDVEWLPAKGLKTCTGVEAPAATESYFLGRWQLFTGGGGHWEKKGSGDWHVKAGEVAKAPPLVIDKNGTYTWVIDSKTTVKGNWHVAEKSELKYGYENRGLTLLLAKGEDGKDWLVSRDLAYASDGGDAILIERRDLGLTYRGYKKK